MIIDVKLKKSQFNKNSDIETGKLQFFNSGIKPLPNQLQSVNSEQIILENFSKVLKNEVLDENSEKIENFNLNKKDIIDRNKKLEFNTQKIKPIR